MKHFLNENVGIKALSLLLAVLFWFFTLSSENTFFVFPQKLSIEAFNVPEGLAVANELGTVELTVRADSEIYKRLTPEDFSIYVDLKGLAEGERDVNVVVNVKKSEVTIVSISPATIGVELEEVTQKSMAVEVNLEGEPAEHYEAQSLEGDEIIVQLSGARSVVQNVASIEAEVSFTGGETTSTVFTVSLVAVDGEGQPISNVTIKPSEVDIEVLVERMESQKTVGIKVNVESIPEGWVESLSVIPATVHIQGELELLEAIDYLETEPIEVTSGQATIELIADLVLPDGITLAEGESDSVEVTLMVAKDEPLEP